MKNKATNPSKISDELTMLMEDLRRDNRQVLEKHLVELVSAYRVGREASSFLEMEKCIGILGDRIADLLSVQIVSIMLMDREKGELVIKLAKGLEDKIVKEAKVKIGENVAGWIVKTGEPLLIDDITKDQRFQQCGGKYNTNSLLSVPLKIRNKVIGVINVNNKISKEVFRTDDLVILRTIADMAAIAIENARLQEETKAIDKMKSDFIANISHDLRAPLSVISEAVRNVLDGLAGTLTEKQCKFLTLAKQNVERLAHLIDELLELSRLESQKTTMKRRLFDVVDLARTTLSSLQPLAHKKKLLTIDALPAENIKVWGDPGKLSQVFTNLIDNAIKYNKQDGSIRVAFEDSGRMIKITITDTGPGIAPQYYEKIFDRFRRIESESDRNITGMGLGLAIAREIARIHGGDITVDSSLGEGSTFTVTLPKDLRKG